MSFRVGRWLLDGTAEEYSDWLVEMVTEASPEVGQVRAMMQGRLAYENPVQLAQQLCRLYAFALRIRTFLADAEGLLDKATKRFLSPPGRHVPAVNEETGEVVCDSRGNPKLHAVTDLDRKSDLDHDTAPFRRWRDELQHLVDVMENSRILGQRILDMAERGA